MTDSRLDRYLVFDRANRRYFDWQLEQFSPYLGRRILEIGCGVGSIAERLMPRDTYVGLDIEPELLEDARERFHGNASLEFHLIDVTRASHAQLDDLRAMRFDTVVAINVLEHIEDDVRALSRIREILCPEGHLALLVPAHPTLYGAYDKLDGHFRRYRSRELREKLKAAGFDIDVFHHFNSIGAIGWWAQYRLLRRSAPPDSELGLMNSLVPLMKRVERAVKPPFGLSVVAVAHPGDGSNVEF